MLAQKIESTANEKFREMVATRHWVRMGEEYVEKRNIDEALFHASLSYRYNPNPEELVIGNNLGYLFMAVGELGKARHLLERAVDICVEPQDCALCNYNLGVLEAKSGDLKSALVKIELSIEQAKNLNEQKREISCLFIPRAVNEEIKFEEIEKPDLLEVAREAQKILQSLLDIESK